MGNNGRKALASQTHNDEKAKTHQTVLDVKGNFPEAACLNLEDTSIHFSHARIMHVEDVDIDPLFLDRRHDSITLEYTFQSEQKKPMVGPGRPQIVLFGSSIVQYSFSDGGWGATLANIYSRTADIILRGYAGWNSRSALKVLNQVFPKDAVIQPSLVIVYFGGNDSMPPHPSGQGPHVPLSEFTDNMRKIGEHLLSLSDKTRVIFLTPPPMNERQIQLVFGDAMRGRSNELCRPYAVALLNLCREINVKGIDLWNAIQQQDDCDGIHFTAKASEIVVKEILRVVREADWKPSLHRKSLPVEFPFDSGLPNSPRHSDLEISRNKKLDPPPGPGMARL
ncbi:hypothetical protein YC2023_047373 [Brassica napus]